jgi:hypothetical protein
MTRMLFAVLLAASIFAWTPFAQAAEPPAERIAVGDEAPAISLPDSAGTVHESTELRGEKNLVVVFFRGAW